MLARHDQNPAHRPAHLGDHRRGLESVVGHRAGQPQRARELAGLNGDHLHVRHLVLRNGEQLRRVRISMPARKTTSSGWRCCPGAASASATAHAKASAIADPIRVSDIRGQFSWQAPGSHGFAKLLEREQIGRQRLAVGKLRGAIAALGVQKIQQARGAALVSVFADVAILLRLVQIARAVKLDDLVVRAAGPRRRRATSVSTWPLAAFSCSCAWSMAYCVRAISPWLRSKIGIWIWPKSEAVFRSRDVRVIDLRGHVASCRWLLPVRTGCSPRSRLAAAARRSGRVGQAFI